MLHSEICCCLLMTTARCLRYLRAFECLEPRTAEEAWKRKTEASLKRRAKRSALENSPLEHSPPAHAATFNHTARCSPQHHNTQRWTTSKSDARSVTFSGRHREPELNHIPDSKIPQRAKIQQRALESPAFASKFSIILMVRSFASFLHVHGGRKRA